MEDFRLNVALLKRRVPNLTTAAKSVGLRPATVSNLCTGKIPVGRAEVRTLYMLAELANCSMDELLIKGKDTEMLETGIKVLDVFSPLVLGGTVGFVARPMMGQLVLLSEIFYRMKEKEIETIFILPEEDHPGLDDVKNAAKIVCSSIDEAYEKIIEVGKNKEVLLAADRTTVLTGEVYSLQERVEETAVHSLTTILVDPRGEAVDETEPFGPLETLIQFDAELIARNIYPAVNPILSTSTVLEGAHLDSTHMIIQQRARKLLRRYRELRYLVDAKGYDKIPESEVKLFERGKRMEAYLTQSFYVAEPFTKREGVSVSLQDALNDLQKIMNGAADNLEVEKLFYVGTLGAE